MPDWSAIFSALTASAAIVAAVVFIGREMVKHLSDRELARHKSALDEQAKENFLALKAKVDSALAEQKAASEQDLERLRQFLNADQAMQERLRVERLRWANRLIDAIDGLKKRLDNILEESAWPALSTDSKGALSQDWSITADYFIPSTSYLFSQYFYFTRRLNEEVNPEIFGPSLKWDEFLHQLRSPGKALSNLPLEGLEGTPGTDTQVFTLQQRALGESMSVTDASGVRCKTYAEFLDCWKNPPYSTLLAPVKSMIEGLSPDRERRWNRLKLCRNRLSALSGQARALFIPEKGSC